MACMWHARVPFQVPARATALGRDKTLSRAWPTYGKGEFVTGAGSSGLTEAKATHALEQSLP